MLHKFNQWSKNSGIDGPTIICQVLVQPRTSVKANSTAIKLCYFAIYTKFTGVVQLKCYSR